MMCLIDHVESVHQTRPHILYKTSASPDTVYLILLPAAAAIGQGGRLRQKTLLEKEKAAGNNQSYKTRRSNWIGQKQLRGPAIKNGADLRIWKLPFLTHFSGCGCMKRCGCMKGIVIVLSFSFSVSLSLSLSLLLLFFFLTLFLSECEMPRIAAAGIIPTGFLR
jgi:hypothetical protein